MRFLWRSLSAAPVCLLHLSVCCTCLCAAPVSPVCVLHLSVCCTCLTCLCAAPVCVLHLSVCCTCLTCRLLLPTAVALLQRPLLAACRLSSSSSARRLSSRALKLRSASSRSDTPTRTVQVHDTYTNTQPVHSQQLLHLQD
ncbi:hypothetical protein EYF80_067528 [Liparis tanakae]|uniref:Uncharacterized protein n=1 Tax=Liparis tanakae TaxID=230148 RepID=A0A4Z2E0W5_9TELE|nr:hypothetical protein EYF80_067528 [Liparis tanakae]